MHYAEEKTFISIVSIFISHVTKNGIKSLDLNIEGFMFYSVSGDILL